MHFEDTFPSHLFVEMCYGRENKFGFIFEQNLPHRDFNYLCEAYGVFNGCYELAREIFEIGKNKNFNETFTYIPINIDFIDKINVNVRLSPNSGYSPTESKLVKGKFRPLKLYIGFRTTDEKIISAIMHELLHAYEDYKRKTNKAIDINTKAKNIGYFKNRQNQTNEGMEYKISMILYFLNNFERNAYVTQMIGLLRTCDKKFYDINEVLKFIKSTVPYKNYQTIFTWAEELCDIESEYWQSYVLKIVNKRSEHNFTTFNQFLKWMVINVLKFQKKFNNVIPKIAAEYLDMVETLHSPITELIK